MKHFLNPKKALESLQKKNEREAEAERVLRERLTGFYDKKHKKECSLFTEKLKACGITALTMKTLSEEASKNPYHFVTWEVKSSTSYKPRYLSDVVDKTLFSRILIIIRDMYAIDIASDISFPEAVKISMYSILLGQNAPP